MFRWSKDNIIIVVDVVVVAAASSLGQGVQLCHAMRQSGKFEKRGGGTHKINNKRGWGNKAVDRYYFLYTGKAMINLRIYMIEYARQEPARQS